MAVSTKCTECGKIKRCRMFKTPEGLIVYRCMGCQREYGYDKEDGQQKA